MLGRCGACAGQGTLGREQFVEPPLLMGGPEQLGQLGQVQESVSEGSSWQVSVQSALEGGRRAGSCLRLQLCPCMHVTPFAWTATALQATSRAAKFAAEVVEARALPMLVDLAAGRSAGASDLVARLVGVQALAPMCRYGEQVGGSVFAWLQMKAEGASDLTAGLVGVQVLAPMCRYREQVRGSVFRQTPMRLVNCSAPLCSTAPTPPYVSCPNSCRWSKICWSQQTRGWCW